MAKLATVFAPQVLKPEPDFPELQIPTSPQTHQVAEKELLFFLNNPFELIGKQFALKQDNLLYEVVKFEASKGKSHRFGVQFAGCVSAVEMESDEMRILLQESYQVDD